MKGRDLESTWNDTNWPFTAEQDLGIFLAMAQKAFSADRSNSLPAFEALGYVASYYWNTDQAPGSVSVPFWVVETIAEGYLKYRVSHARPDGLRLRFGEALQVEGHGQGKRPRIHDHLKRLRDIRVATHLVLLEEQGWKIDAAIQELATRTGMDHTTVRDLWSRYADQARTALQIFRQSDMPSDQTS